MKNGKRWCAGLLLFSLILTAAGCSKPEGPAIKQREITKKQQEIVLDQNEEADETLNKTFEKINKGLEEYEPPAFEEPAAEAPAEEPAAEEPAQTPSEGDKAQGDVPAEEPAGEEPTGEEPAKLDETPADGAAPAEEPGDPIYEGPQTLEEYLSLDGELSQQIQQIGIEAGMGISATGNDLCFTYTFPEELDDDMLSILKPLLQLTMMEMDSQGTDLARQLEEATGLQGITVTIVYKEKNGKTICQGTFGGRP